MRNVSGCQPTLTVLPLDVVSLQADRPSMIQTGLANRPELRESQSLVAAACERYQREKYSPFVPSVLLGFSNGGFGGGVGSTLNNVDDRYDFDALVSWQIRNLGFGEHAARRDTSAQVQQAKFEKIRMMDQVAREVSEAYSQVSFRSQQVTVAQQAIQNAIDSYDRNVSRIRDGQGLPLESLQSLLALGSGAASLRQGGCRIQSGAVPSAMGPWLAGHGAGRGTGGDCRRQRLRRERLALSKRVVYAKTSSTTRPWTSVSRKSRPAYR